MILLLVILGLLVGLISTIFGVGGGIIAVPSLYALFPKLSPQTVIATSLGMIFLNSLINTFNFYKLKFRAPLKIILILSINMIIGVILGGELTFYLNKITIKQIFVVVIVLVAFKTLLYKKKDSSNEVTWNVKGLIMISLTALLGGLVSGLTGLGGGAVLVPLFISLLKLPLKKVPFYSNIAMASGTGAGVINYMLRTPKTPVSFEWEVLNHFQIGHVNCCLLYTSPSPRDV